MTWWLAVYAGGAAWVTLLTTILVQRTVQSLHGEILTRLRALERVVSAHELGGVPARRRIAQPDTMLLEALAQPTQPLPRIEPSWDELLGPRGLRSRPWPGWRWR